MYVKCLLTLHCFKASYNMTHFTEDTKFQQILPVVSQSFCADRRTDMSQLTVATAQFRTLFNRHHICWAPYTATAL
jgi:hypothetical protein